MERLWRRLPEDARNEGCKLRGWNYLQQRLIRAKRDATRRAPVAAGGATGSRKRPAPSYDDEDASTSEQSSYLSVDAAVEEGPDESEPSDPPPRRRRRRAQHTTADIEDRDSDSRPDLQDERFDPVAHLANVRRVQERFPLPQRIAVSSETQLPRAGPATPLVQIPRQDFGPWPRDIIQHLLPDQYMILALRDFDAVWTEYWEQIRLLRDFAPFRGVAEADRPLWTQNAWAGMCLPWLMRCIDNAHMQLWNHETQLPSTFDQITRLNALGWHDLSQVQTTSEHLATFQFRQRYLANLMRYSTTSLRTRLQSATSRYPSQSLRPRPADAPASTAYLATNTHGTNSADRTECGLSRLPALFRCDRRVKHRLAIQTWE